MFSYARVESAPRDRGHTDDAGFRYRDIVALLDLPLPRRHAARYADHMMSALPLRAAR